ncbi:AfsR/SARP family transcriptional regulator [Allonocardiopsis opalescens]|uniref:DNA-binding SARP family transcriptional activator n=1 Tax=Allonocardiopsis opalescens TaxID=1144618 RepID=A0A2T0Q302_9ACTN|nr:BTAD domain-containing putative transcriptional regulator [Allonocardiopsis opalescens]PRX98048.1 DNA-binding SARP family transcriptional activator [Allonocardiopsis opalescens]
MCRIEFGVLGPFEAVFDGRRIPIPRGRQRVLLASLVLNANDVVSVDELLERLWGDRLPSRPRGALQTCLTRLRHWLDAYAEGASELVRTSSAGYVMELPDHSVDLLRARRLLREAEAAAGRGDLLGQSIALTAVLGLWRGAVLSDVRSDSLHRDVVPRLAEEYLRALEWRCEVGLALGRHDELVGDLVAVTRRYPFQERFWQQLMIALCRCGRQVEALAAYRQVSTHLRDEIGIDPGPELRKLHVAILRNDLAVMSHGAR